MDPVPSLGCSLKDVKWSPVAVPLDLLVSTYRLPQIARLDSGGHKVAAASPFYPPPPSSSPFSSSLIFIRKQSERIGDIQMAFLFLFVFRLDPSPHVGGAAHIQNRLTLLSEAKDSDTRLECSDSEECGHHLMIGSSQKIALVTVTQYLDEGSPVCFWNMFVLIINNESDIQCDHYSVKQSFL
ncbi:hypothetical protein STEG23_024335, partial [Scotinomys teguina]